MSPRNLLRQPLPWFSRSGKRPRRGLRRSATLLGTHQRRPLLQFLPVSESARTTLQHHEDDNETAGSRVQCQLSSEWTGIGPLPAYSSMFCTPHLAQFALHSPQSPVASDQSRLDSRGRSLDRPLLVSILAKPRREGKIPTGRHSSVELLRSTPSTTDGTAVRAEISSGSGGRLPHRAAHSLRVSIPTGR